MNRSSAQVLQLPVREAMKELPEINDKNLGIALQIIGQTEDEMLETFYEDNFKDKLIIKDKDKFIKDYIKAYIKIYTEQAERYCASS